MIRKMAGTLNSKPRYFGSGQEYFRFQKYVKVFELHTYNPLNAPVYREGYWRYTKNLNVNRFGDKVYTCQRDWNYKRVMRQRKIHIRTTK